jgi:hypothetical protein
MSGSVRFPAASTSREMISKVGFGFNKKTCCIAVLASSSASCQLLVVSARQDGDPWEVVVVTGRRDPV